MPKYKNQGDIPYLKFIEFTKEIEGNNDEHFIADKVMYYFYPNESDVLKCTNEFQKALTTETRKVFKYRLSLSKLDNASDFIDADTFANDNDIESLLKLIVKPWHGIGKVNVHKISLAAAQSILGNFLLELSK
jgi:hypothetical protein